MEKTIARMKNHFIICGYGKMGMQVALEFQKAGVPFVALDHRAEVFQHDNARDILHLVGNATREDDLERCGIRSAIGLVSVLGHDQDNVYVILTALGINPAIRIVTRASDQESEKKLLRAGASQVVSPFKIGGSRIASIMLRPTITHFLDGLARAEDIRLTLVEVEVTETSCLRDKSILDTGITNISESIIVGIRRKGQAIQIRPPLDMKLEAGDRLVLMGQIAAIDQVNQYLNSSH